MAVRIDTTPAPSGASRAMRSLPAAWAHIAAQPSRIVATVVAIVIGIGFACAALVFTSTFHADLAARVSAQYSGADLVVTPHGDGPAAATAARIAAVPGVAAAEPLYAAGVRYTAKGSHGYLELQAVPTEKRLRWATLADGRWPSRPAEIAVAKATATAANVPIGATLTFTGPDDTSVTARVVGLADVSSSPLAGGEQLAFAPAATFADLGITGAPEIAVLAAPGVGPGHLRSAVAAVTDADVRTAAQQAAADVARLTGQTTALTTVLLAFAAIALVVAGIVIANTFTILLTQRRRQIALLRCVGATGGQVRTEVVAEAGLIGAVGSVLGAALGIGVGAAAASVTGLDSGGLAVPVTAILVTALIGVALTIGAALLPARRAMRIPPLAALRPVVEAVAARRAGRARVITGLALVAVGGLLLGAGVYGHELLVALPGGAISAVGVLLLTRSFLPPLLSLVGRIGSAAGVVGRLAAANAVRNPGRAAATSAALVVGVGLIVMLQVAAASVGASVDRATADRYPVDLAVAGNGTPLPADVIDGVHRAKGLSGTVDIRGAAATVSDGAPANSGADGAHVTLLGVPPDASSVVRGGLGPLGGGSAAAPPVLVPTWWIGGGLSIGDEITVTVGGHAQRFTVTVGRLTEAGVTGTTLVTTAAALRTLAPSAPTAVIWASVPHPADAVDVMSSLNSLVATHAGVYVTGSAADRASLQSVVGTVTTVATGLLAVAVVIAIVGIGNTIGLSVVERTRESALLRALGLRRGQLRLMLAVEAMLLALIGALVGIVLGLMYGWAGSAATFGQIGRTLVFEVPWGTVMLVAALAVAAGAVASVLPARRAVRATPVAALAQE